MTSEQWGAFSKSVPAIDEAVVKMQSKLRSAILLWCLKSFLISKYGGFLVFKMEINIQVDAMMF